MSSAVKEVKRTTGKVSAEASRAGESAMKAGTSLAAGATDPATFVAAATGGFLGGTAMTGAKATEAWGAMSDAEKADASARAEQAMAMQKERDAKLKQEKMVADKAKGVAAQAKERATRLGQGRRGLLYQGKEQGVTGKSTVLGG